MCVLYTWTTDLDAECGKRSMTSKILLYPWGTPLNLLVSHIFNMRGNFRRHSPNCGLGNVEYQEHQKPRTPWTDTPTTISIPTTTQNFPNSPHNTTHKYAFHPNQPKQTASHRKTTSQSKQHYTFQNLGTRRCAIYSLHLNFPSPSLPQFHHLAPILLSHIMGLRLIPRVQIDIRRSPRTSRQPIRHDTHRKQSKNIAVCVVRRLNPFLQRFHPRHFHLHPRS